MQVLSTLPGCHSAGPGAPGSSQPGDAERLPGRQHGAGDPCQPRGPSGTLRSRLAIPTLQQPAWQAAGDSASLEATGAHLPAWQGPGSRGAPAPSTSRVELGGRRASCRPLPGVSASLAGAGEPPPLLVSLIFQEIDVGRNLHCPSGNHNSPGCNSKVIHEAPLQPGHLSSAVQHLLRLQALLALPKPSTPLGTGHPLPLAGPKAQGHHSNDPVTHL